MTASGLLRPIDVIPRTPPPVLRLWVTVLISEGCKIIGVSAAFVVTRPFS